MAYTEAAKQTKKKYALLMNGSKLDVVEKGTLIEDYEANGYTNVLNERFAESIENMVNQVVITDAEGECHRLSIRRRPNQKIWLDTGCI